MKNKKEICPLCGGENGCATATGSDPYSCWCMTVKVPQELLDRIPKEKRGEACVCKKCVEKYIKEKQEG
ncbi:cysteine-rich CWC family protein [uncultured Ilyobacter sp.]|uniref:cysteine-rich CWC family protein n=1 Tax=uncultured Ilyobacter sp. TaxID=544433 RepID=UPI0029C7DBA8|nr:cysteine-rich CWC family protein [uncultured Ilyobacter sp.]